VTDKQLEEYLSQASTGAFYCLKNGSFPAVDFFVHLADGTLLLVQIKFSDEDATTRVSTTDVVDCIAGLTDKLKFLAGRKIVFVYCALRKGRQNFFLEKDEVSGVVPEGCSEIEQMKVGITATYQLIDNFEDFRSEQDLYNKEVLKYLNNLHALVEDLNATTNRKLDMIFSGSSIQNRIVMSPLMTGIAEQNLIHLEKEIIGIWKS
jgi:hypothetical protein